MRKPLSFVTVKEPERSEHQRTSVLALLHGVGSNERKMLPFAAGADPRLGIISVRGPVELGADAFGWFHVTFAESGPVIDAAEAEASRSTLLDFLRTYQEAHDVDDVYLMGFSQGAIMAAVTALTQPSAVQGAIAMSGRFPPEFLEQIATPNELSQTALWIGHGIEDQKLPIHHARATQALLLTLGTPFSYHEFPIGHGVSSTMQLSAHNWLTSILATRADAEEKQRHIRRGLKA